MVSQVVHARPQLRIWGTNALAQLCENHWRAIEVIDYNGSVCELDRPTWEISQLQLLRVISHHLTLLQNIHRDNLRRAAGEIHSE